MPDFGEVLLRHFKFRLLVEKLKHFELLVIKTSKLIQKVGCVNITRSDVFESALILWDRQSVLKFFLPNFFLKLISLKMNSRKRQQKSHLLLNWYFLPSTILKRRLDNIQRIRYVIIMYLDKGLDSVKLNVSRVTLKVLTETDVTLFGLVVVFFGGLEVAVA